jgi:MFS family permease
MEQNDEKNLNPNKKLKSNEKSYSTFDPNRDEQPNFWQSFVRSKQSIIITFVLFSMSVTNITDRYLVSSVLIDIQKYFDVSKSVAGLLQTAFLLVYMAFSPLSGYLGDRVNRKYLLVVSLVIWITSTFSGSLVNEKQFGLFVLSRCMFGVATAPFETIAVPIIGDQFRNNKVARNRALILFNLGPPVGTGLSYLIGTVSKDLHPNDWRWCLRFTPVFLTFILFLILLAYIDPKRNDSQSTSSNYQQRTFMNDLKILFRNKTYVLLIISWTCGLASLSNF